MRRFFFILLMLPGSAWANDNYVGAEAFLRKVASATNKVAAVEGAGQRLVKDLQSFKEKRGSLPAEQAAREWLELLNRFWDLTAKEIRDVHRNNPNDALSFDSFIAALPPPSAWEDMARLINDRPSGNDEQIMRELALGMLAATLLGDREAFMAKKAEFTTALAKRDDYLKKYLDEQLQKIVLSFNTISGDKSGIMTSVEQLILDRVSSADPGSIDMPDAVSLIGPENAELLLRKALVLPNTTIRISLGDETKSLARKLALELIDEMKTPQWSLAASLDSGELYEAMEKKFSAVDTTNNTRDNATIDMQSIDIDPSTIKGLNATEFRAIKSMVVSGNFNSENQSRAIARQYYMLSLVASGRLDEARAVALSLAAQINGQRFPYNALNEMKKAGYAKEVHDFIQHLLKENPDLPFWDQYIALSADVGRTQEMLELMHAYSSNTALRVERRNELNRLLVNALLADDQVEEAVVVLRELLGAESEKENDVLAMALQLGRLGQLLGRPEWLEEGLASATKASLSEDNGNSFNTYGYKRLVEFLVQSGRGPEAEALVLKHASRLARTTQQVGRYSYDNDSNSDMSMLVGVYHAAGRMQDIKTLMDLSPWWGLRDLKDLLNDNEYSHYGNRKEAMAPVIFAAADALNSLGQTNEALEILEALLLRIGGYDPAYELYTTIQGSDAIPFLDRIYESDRYEERPLIWKSHVLRLAGNVDDAKRIAQEAIAIDPSDGEQGKGRRMRVYQEMALIAEAQNDPDQAAFFHNVIKAIRLAEEADDFYDAGLLSRGVAMYEEALNYFADAYCIQSRLAVQLEEMGRYDEAEKHYQKAYELMPDSFGRVESHCFGCEGVFQSGRAQLIAERVFTSLAKNNPEKPQVHYLLGYLRESQDRTREALASYQLAVKLDPDYLNAWKKISKLGETLQLPSHDRDAAILHQLRLDPLSRHGTPDFKNMYDLKALWIAAEKAAAWVPQEPDALYPFKTSAAILDKRDARLREGGNRNYWSRQRVDSRNPGSYIEDHTIISGISSLIDSIESQ